MKKPVVKKETIASLKAELKLSNTSFDELLNRHVELRTSSEGLKKSFDMVKANFEREKNRLDKTIDSLLNITKK